MDALYAMHHLMDDEDGAVIDKICECKHKVALIMKFLKSGLDEESRAAARVIGHIFSGPNAKNIDIFLFNGALDAMSNLLTPDSAAQTQQERTELLWALSNVTAGTADHIRAFMSHPALLDQVLSFTESTHGSVQAESILVLTNLVTTCPDSHITK